MGALGGYVVFRGKGMVWVGGGRVDMVWYDRNIHLYFHTLPDTTRHCVGVVSDCARLWQLPIEYLPYKRCQYCQIIRHAELILPSLVLALISHLG